MSEQSVQQRGGGGRVGQAQQQQEDNSPEKLLWSAEGHIGAVLPQHLNAKGWIGVAIAAIRRDDKLYAAAAKNPGSLMSALLRAAMDGLKPGTEEFYLVPYGNEVQGLRGYQGELALIYRAGAVASVEAQIVHANDKFEFQPGTNKPPVHIIDWMGDRGEMKLVYAFAHMKDGTISNVVVKTEAEVLQHRAASPSYRSKPEASPWTKWPKSMWLKTAVHELHKWVPTSSEFIIERLNAQANLEVETVKAKALARAQLAISPSVPSTASTTPPSGMAGLDQQVDKETGELPPEPPKTEEPKQQQEQPPAEPAQESLPVQEPPAWTGEPPADWVPPGRDEEPTTTNRRKNR